MNSPAKLTFSHQKHNFFPKIFASSKFSPYLCRRLTDDSSLSGRATVSPMASWPQAFFMPREFISLTGEKYFPNWGKRKTLYGGCMNRRFD